MEKQTAIRNGFVKPVIIKENLLIENFVSPQLCIDLIKLGLPAKNIFKWIIKGETILLDSRLFEYDCDAEKRKLNKLMATADYVVNAYTVMDLVKFCPEFSLATINKSFRIGGLLMSTCDMVEHVRFPDLFAEYLKVLLQKKVLVFK